MEWISIKNTLPKIGSDKRFPNSSSLILLSDGKIVFPGLYEQDKNEKYFIDPNGNDYKDHGIKVTHWMEFPEPPKK